jgi:sugar O-acyltransferase (sialic acid O-acetyltransferase NeuD family)
MNKPIVIVGTAMLAEQVHYYFSGQAQRVVEAFAVDAEYLRDDSFCGKPVLEFEEALRRYPASTHELFLAIGFTATEARKRKFIAARERGYTLPSYVHPSAHVADNVRVGANTLIQELAMVSPFVQLGDDLMLCPQVSINHHTRVGAHCFIAPAAVIAGAVDIGELCFIGANATIRDRVRIGEGCRIGAGAWIVDDCEPWGVYRVESTTRSRAMR